jgi:hypothetical protein
MNWLAIEAALLPPFGPPMPSQTIQQRTPLWLTIAKVSWFSSLTLPVSVIPMHSTKSVTLSSLKPVFGMFEATFENFTSVIFDTSFYFWSH